MLLEIGRQGVVQAKETCSNVSLPVAADDRSNYLIDQSQCSISLSVQCSD